MKKIRAKHLILAFSGPFVLYAILGGFLGRALARDTAYRYLSVFQDVVTLIMNNYLEPAEMDVVMDGAVRGMMDALDPDSGYLTAEEYEAFLNPDASPHAGIGVEVTKRYYLQIVSVAPASPADKADLKPGDLIKSIDGQNTRGVNVIAGDALLRGATGSEMELEVIRGGQPDPLIVTVTRQEIVSSPVEFRMLDDSTGYIQVTAFRSGSDTDVKRAIELLKGQGAQELVLDIRNSYGRIAEDGVHVAELFMSGGIAAKLQSRKGETTELKLADDRVAFDGPVAVLINGGSSGSAEIMASAFRTAKRAELIGVPTPGRSAVQKAIPLGDGTALVLSVAQYWTPDGKPLLGEGLEPTIEVSRGRDVPEDADPVLDKALEVLQEASQAKVAA